MRRPDPTSLLAPVPATLLLFAAGVAALSLTALLQLAPGGDVPALLPLSQTHMNRAFALAGPGRTPGPAELARAEAEIRLALASSPARSDAWLALAQVKAQEEGGWSPEATAALARSYAAGPLDPDVGFWRLGLAYDNWPLLPPALRARAADEAAAMWTRTAVRTDLRVLASQVRNPIGRLALTARLAALQKSEPSAQAAATGAAARQLPGRSDAVRRSGLKSLPPIGARVAFEVLQRKAAGFSAVTVPLARVALAAAVCLTAWGAFGPSDGAGGLIPWDKAGHFLAFYALTLLSVLSFRAARLPLVIAVLAASGAGIEFIQATPWVHRDAEFGDFVADMAGVGAVILPILIVTWLKPDRND